MTHRDWEIARNLLRPNKKKAAMENFLSTVSTNEVNETDYFGTTLLYLVAWTGFVDLTNTLILKGANVNVKNFRKWTPIHVAAYHGHLNLIKFLIANGADVNARTKTGVTPLRAAASSGKGKAVILLRNYGGK